jgi:hypothetical protein
MGSRSTQVCDGSRLTSRAFPAGNANFAWVQHIVHHLAPAGVAGFVLANGSMSSNQSGEGEIRRSLIEAELVDCMVALPGQLSYSTQIPACLWFLARDRKNGKFRDRRGQVLFIDPRKLGRMVDRTHRELADEDVARIANTYHAWRGEKEAGEPKIHNSYGVQSGAFSPEGTQPLLIYPTPAKYGETLGMPYSELFRRFAGAIVRPQSVLFIVGYGFGDEHVNAIVRQALAVPSFTLVIVDPEPKSDFVKKLREQRDRRVWIAKGPAVGTLAGFVEHVLPDLRDEEIRKKVLATHRALARSGPGPGGTPDGD